jgi:hypothetical protein
MLIDCEKSSACCSRRRIQFLLHKYPKAEFGPHRARTKKTFNFFCVCLPSPTEVRAKRNSSLLRNDDNKESNWRGGQEEEEAVSLVKSEKQEHSAQFVASIFSVFLFRNILDDKHTYEGKKQPKKKTLRVYEEEEM